MTLRTLTAAGAVVLILAVSLGACGKMGELQKPSALNGAGRATDTQATEQQRQAQDPSRPVDAVDPRDRAIDPAPPRTLPIPSSGLNPDASQVQGALPNPYANPR